MFYHVCIFQVYSHLQEWDVDQVGPRFLVLVAKVKALGLLADHLHRIVFCASEARWDFQRSCYIHNTSMTAGHHQLPFQFLKQDSQMPSMVRCILICWKQSTIQHAVSLIKVLFSKKDNIQIMFRHTMKSHSLNIHTLHNSLSLCVCV